MNGCNSGRVNVRRAVSPISPGSGLPIAVPSLASWRQRTRAVSHISPVFTLSFPVASSFVSLCRMTPRRRLSWRALGRRAARLLRIRVLGKQDIRIALTRFGPAIGKKPRSIRACSSARTSADCRFSVELGAIRAKQQTWRRQGRAEGSSNRASRYRCTTVTQPWPNLEPGATTWKVVAKRESSDEIVRWIGRRP